MAEAQRCSVDTDRRTDICHLRLFARVSVGRWWNAATAICQAGVYAGHVQWLSCSWPLSGAAPVYYFFVPHHLLSPLSTLYLLYPGALKWVLSAQEWIRSACGICTWVWTIINIWTANYLQRIFMCLWFCGCPCMFVSCHGVALICMMPGKSNKWSRRRWKGVRAQGRKGTRA